MTTLLITFGLLFILIIGFRVVYRKHKKTLDSYDFAFNYRNKFIECSNKYFKNHDRWSQSGELDNELYVWLTKNVNKVQRDLGSFGIMDYMAPFQRYHVENYQIIVNTIPKFRNGQIQEFDVTSVDDCLLRYIGYQEERIEENRKNLKNPFVWFRIGFQEIISIPLYIFNWFGIFSKRTVNSIMDSVIYKIFTGIIALVTLTSSIVSIIQGKEKTIELINKILGN